MLNNLGEDIQPDANSDDEDKKTNNEATSQNIEEEIEKRYDNVFKTNTAKILRQYDDVEVARIKNLPPAKSTKGFFIGLSMLLGIPLVFGVLAQAIVGVVIGQEVIHGLGETELDTVQNLPLLKIAYVLIICALIFMAGHIFYDISEVRKDRRIHKHKPLANKLVPLWFAWLLGCAFMIGAGFLAYYQASKGTFLVVLMLIVAIFIFVLVAKYARITSAVVIGLYNIIFIYLGASAVISIPDDIIYFKDFIAKEILWFFPASIGIYMIGVTLVSTLEDYKPAPVLLTVSNLLILIGLVVPPGFNYVQVHLNGELMQTMWELPFITSMSLAGGVILVLVIVMMIALYDNTAKNLHRIFTVGRLGLIWLCASIVASLGMTFTSMVIALLSVPAMMIYQQFPDPAKRRIHKTK